MILSISFLERINLARFIGRYRKKCPPEGGTTERSLPSVEMTVKCKLNKYLIMEKPENNSKLINLIKFDRINILLENFNKATGFVTAILDDEGNVLSKSGWRNICTEFHRANTESAKICTQSDLMLSGKLAKGQNYHCHNCLNGLVDAAVPIVINDQFVGNLFTGQFFLKKPDREFFQKQALKYGFDEKAYLEALDKVPIVTESQVNHVMNFLLSMTELISEMTMQSSEQVKLKNSIEKREEKYRGLFNSIRDSILVTDIKRNIVDCNPAFSSLFGYTKEEILGKQTVYVYESEAEFRELGEALKTDLGNKPFLKTVNYKKKSGEIFPGETNLFHLKNDKGELSGFIGLIRDITERKNTLLELEENEKKLQKLLNSLNAGVIVHGSDTSIISSNPRASELLGLSIEQLIGKQAIDPGWKFLDKNNKALPFEEYPVNKIISTREAIEGMVMGVTRPKTNDTVWLILNGVPFYNTNGNLIKIIISFIDITKSKLAEEEIKNKEKQFRTIVESAGDAMFLADFKTQKIILANEQACKELGYSIDELLGLRLNEIDPTYMNEEDVDKLWSTFKIDIPITIETQHKRKDGSIFPVEVKTVLINYNGKKTVLGFTRDITERKVAVEKIQQSEKRYRMLFNLLPYGGEVLDIHGNIINCSSSTAKMLGYSISEIIGQPIARFLAPESLLSFKNKFPILLSGNPTNAEIQLIHKDGSRLDILRAAQPLLDENGNVESILALNLNITERKQAQKSANRFSRIFEDTQNEIYLYDAKTLLFAQANKAALLNLGYTMEELQAMTPIDLKPDYTAQAFADLIEPLRKGKKEKLVFETIHQRKDQSLYNVEVHLQLLRFEQEDMFSAIIIDITDRKRAEKELAQYREHLEELVKERTIEINEKNQKLSDQMKIFVGREMTIIGLQNRIKTLEGK